MLIGGVILSVIIIGIIVLRILENRYYNESVKIDDVGIDLEGPNRPTDCPWVELDTIYIDDGMDADLLSKHLVNMLGKIKRGQERLVAKIYIEPVVKVPLAKKKH